MTQQERDQLLIESKQLRIRLQQLQRDSHEMWTQVNKSKFAQMLGFRCK
jgi:hypothetical protein